jgi:hypothetical protein
MVRQKPEADFQPSGQNRWKKLMRQYLFINILASPETQGPPQVAGK